MKNYCLNITRIFILSISLVDCANNANKAREVIILHPDEKLQPSDSLTRANFSHRANNDPIKIDSFFIDEDLVGDPSVVYNRLQNTPKISVLAYSGMYPYKFNFETDTHLVIAPNYKAIKPNPNLPMPFAKIDYDRVLAVDFDQKHERTGVHVLKGDSLFIENGWCYQVKDLTEKQVSYFCEVAGSKETYGRSGAFCFYPRIAFVFLKENQVEEMINICLECKQLRTSIVIPAMGFYPVKTEIGNTYYLDGFSDSGLAKLQDICLELGFNNCN